jgi:transcriptional/translational regulatory protein YebC/TACO1
MYFNRSGGSLGKTGSLDFLFERKGIFRIAVEQVEVEELELELIDFGAEEVVQVEETEVVIQTAFEDFGSMQKALEEKGFNVVSAQLQRIPTTLTKLGPDEEEKLLNLIEKIEEDEDVQAVYHNMEE